MSKKGESNTAHQALYRKYRPTTLADVVGQAQVTDVLRRSLAQGKIAHAYLLTGPKGTGKTSIARILAHEINQLPYDGEATNLDIIEIDAASNNGVEDVRDLREKVQIAPVSAAKKVYIIDEVHMLSKPAFNALLKTLEEPPAHVVFILATTDLHKVPSTIISRTQHFTFHNISVSDLAAQLRKIADSEALKITDDALQAIAERGDGSFRNSISLLDQLSSFADGETGVTLEFVQETLGLAPTAAIDTLLLAVSRHDTPGVVSQLDALERQGIQPNILADQLIRALRRQLAEHPQTVTLLDALLDVASSSQPQLKLLTTLVTAAKPKTAVAASAMRRPSVAASIASSPPKSSGMASLRVSNRAPASLETRAVDIPEDLVVSGSTGETPARVATSGAAPAFDNSSAVAKEGADRLGVPAKPVSGGVSTGPVGSDLRADFAEAKSNDGSGVNTTGEPPSSPLSEGDVPDRASRAPQAEQSSPVKRPLRKEGEGGGDGGRGSNDIQKAAPTITDFDWPKVVDHSKQNSVALYSVISKCDVDYADGTLTIYASRKFNKTKLDEAKYLTQLHESLAAAGYDGLAVVTLAETKPPANEQLAKLAAMMGGGQEVSLE